MFLIAVLCAAVARKIPFDDPDVLLYVRIGYVFTQALCLAVYYYISQKVCLSLSHPVLFSVPDGGARARVVAHVCGYVAGGDGVGQVEERPDRAQVWYVALPITQPAIRNLTFLHPPVEPPNQMVSLSKAYFVTVL